MYEHQRTAGCEAHVQELVMNVALVGLEGIHLPANTSQHDPTDIQARHQQEAEHQYQRSATCQGSGCSHRPDELNGQETQDETQRQTSRIAHEDFPSSTGIAEHIVQKERNQYPHANSCQQGIHPPSLPYEEKTEQNQGLHTKARSQSVNTVYQIDGIGDEDRQSDGERHAEPCIDMVDAEQSIETVQLKSGQGNESGCQQLYQKLPPIGHTYEVVGNAYDVEQHQPHHETKHLVDDVSTEEIDVQGSRMELDHADATHHQHDNGKESHSAQP